MKKVFSLILTLMLALSVSSCSQGEQTPEEISSFELQGEAKKVFETLRPDDRADDLLSMFGTLNDLHYSNIDALQEELQSFVDRAGKYLPADELNAKVFLDNPGTETGNPSITNYQETGVQMDKEKIFYSILPKLYADKVSADKVLAGDSQEVLSAAKTLGYELTQDAYSPFGILKDHETGSYQSFTLQCGKDKKLLKASIVVEHLDLEPEIQEEFKQFAPPEQLEKTAGNHAVWLKQLTVAEHPVLSQVYTEEEQALLQECLQKIDLDYIGEISEISGEVDGYPVLDWSVGFADTVINFNGSIYELTMTIQPVGLENSSYYMGLIELEKAFVGGETYQKSIHTASGQLEPIR